MVFRRFRVALPLALLMSTALLSSCASAPQAGSAANGPQASANMDSGTGGSETAERDPLEGVNRAVFGFNMAADKYVLKPIAKGYRWAVPGFVRTRIDNVLTNLKQPVVIANDILQANPRRTAESFDRLWMNSIFGLGGMFDVATSVGVPAHEATFGETLGVWGIGSGPYLVLPLLGPSDPRSGVGYAVDAFGDPFSIEMHAHNLDEANYARLGMGIINTRSKHIEDLDELQRTSLDFYAAMRSLYWQSRNADIRDARAAQRAAWDPHSPASSSNATQGAAPRSASGPNHVPTPPAGSAGGTQKAL